MSFHWTQKNICLQSSGYERLQSVSAPLVISLKKNVYWLIVRFNTSGHLDVFRGDGSATGWRRQRGAEHIQTADTPGGAASSDGKTVLLVYRDFWKGQLLWSFWTEDHGWCGNRIIQIPIAKHNPLTLNSNGRGPCVVFCQQQYWIFYVDEEQQLCSVSFSRFNQATGLPVWKIPRTYVSCPTVADGRPTVVIRNLEEEKPTLSVYYHSVKGLACLVLDMQENRIQCYSFGPNYLHGFRGSPVILDFHCLHLFYRNHKNRICWYICQEEVQKMSWTQASDVDLLGIKSSHAPTCYVNEDGELCVLCATHPNFLGDLHFGYSEKPALRFNALAFEKEPHTHG